MSDRMIRVAVLGVLAFALCAPAAAFGAESTSRVVTTVTAGEVATQLAGQVKGVQKGEGGGLLTLAAIPMVGGALIKILNFLAKLGRG